MAAIVLCGCSLEQGAIAPVSDAGHDGPREDSSAGDSSSPADTAMAPDTAEASDSSMSPDTSTEPDASMPADILIEAEDYDRRESIDGFYSWELDTTEPGFRGTGAMQAQPEVGFYRCEVEALRFCGARMAYDFVAPASGVYRVYFRTLAHGPGQDSLYWTMDGAMRQALSTSSSGSWQWTEGASRTLPEGSHTLTVLMRESRNYIDSIFLSATGAPPP